jgi:hypothetical protein
MRSVLDYCIAESTLSASAGAMKFGRKFELHTGQLSQYSLATLQHWHCNRQLSSFVIIVCNTGCAQHAWISDGLLAAALDASCVRVIEQACCLCYCLHIAALRSMPCHCKYAMIWLGWP